MKQLKITIKRKPKTQATEIQKKSKRKYLLIKIIPILIACVFYVFCYDLYIFHDDSMHSNIAIGTILDQNYDRGDVVLVDTGEQIQIRRIVAVPGDEIIFNYNQIYINSKKCEESYIADDTYSFLYRFVIPDGAYFILADNRIGYSDSREYGAVYQAAIKQKILFMI